MLGRMRRWLLGVWIERDDYKMRYEHQYEMKCKAQDECDRWEEDARRYAGNADYWREKAETIHLD